MQIRTISLAVVFAVLAGCAGSGSERRGKDVYPDFASLRAANTAGFDYSREAYDRGSKVTVFAIHGGDIEAATSRVARRVAGRDFNLYIFNGWQGANSFRLHVTAANFDDPYAVRLATGSVLGISIHGQAGRGNWVCVGGRNTTAALLVAQRLEVAGFVTETPCARLPGVADRNIVNLPSAGGVQLEITRRLLNKLDKDAAELAKFSEALRAAAAEYLEAAAAAAR